MATITFQVNLATPLRDSHVPVNTSRAESDNLPSTRDSWLPDKILNNRQLQDGNQFTVDSHIAEYLKSNFTSGDFAPLTIVSDGLVFSTEGEVA